MNNGLLWIKVANSYTALVGVFSALSYQVQIKDEDDNITDTAYTPVIGKTLTHPTTGVITAQDSYNVIDGTKTQEVSNDTAVEGVVAVNTTNYPLALNGGVWANIITATGVVERGIIGTDSTTATGTLTYQLATPIVTQHLPRAIDVTENSTIYLSAEGDPTQSTIPTTSYKLASNISASVIALNSATRGLQKTADTHKVLINANKLSIENNQEYLVFMDIRGMRRLI